MIAHAFNNFAAIVMVWTLGVDEAGVVNASTGYWIAAGIAIVLGAFAIRALRNLEPVQRAG